MRGFGHVLRAQPVTPLALSFWGFSFSSCADHCCNSVHPTWTQSPPKEREGLPDVLSSISAFSRPLHTCNLSIFCCTPITKPASGERRMNIKVSLESLGSEDTIYFCYTWLCRRESVSEQPGSFRQERAVWVE